MKRKIVMAFCALAVSACMVTACASTETKTTEAQTETQTETETETAPLTEEETADASETETEETETETEEAAAEPVTMYVTGDVYVRQEADASSEAIAVAYIGDEVTATEYDEKWCKVTLDDKEGYVVKEYLTESKEEADAAKSAEEAAEAAAAAQAAAQAQQSSQSQGSTSSEKYEVSRQQYDDCDGSGHGYYEITYSDGSVATEEY